MLKKIALAIVALMVIAAVIVTYQHLFATPIEEIYHTQTVGFKTIKQEVKTTGTLELEDDIMKIGSIVPGVIYKMYVEEDEHVRKGQLLAEIDDGKNDTEVHQTEAVVRKNEAIVTYQKAYYERKKALFEQNHISLDAFQKAEQDYRTAQADLEAAQAACAYAKLTFQNKKITAPDDGVVISKISREGETVTLASPATLLYTIARNINKLKARPLIDKNTIGHIRIGAQTVMTFHTYPDLSVTGTLREISITPITTTTGTATYLGSILLDNSKLLFKPGMPVDITITMTQKEHVLAVPHYALNLDAKTVRKIAHMEQYAFHPSSQEEKSSSSGTVKSVWIVDDGAIIEKPVTIGIHDNEYYEVVSGLHAGQIIIVDSIEQEMHEETAAT